MPGVIYYIAAANYFIGSVLIPFLFALALLFFLWNVARYFIFNADDQNAREQAKKLALYAVAGFVFLVSIWGIINVIIRGFDLDGYYPVEPDYFYSAPGGGQGWLGGSRNNSDYSVDLDFQLENNYNNTQNNTSPFGENIPIPTPRPDNNTGGSWDGIGSSGNPDFTGETNDNMEADWDPFRDNSGDSINI